MSVLALGISYRRAPIDLIERLSFSKEELPKAYHHLSELDAVRGAVLLSTCNRIEVFADVDAYHGGFESLKRFLCESRGVAPEDLAEPLYSHYEDQAAEHLFSVASGLDSMVPGEPQILSQVRQAYRTAGFEGTATPLLDAMFRRAIHAGRRARNETGIGASPSAFVEAAAGLADAALGGLRGRSALVVGAGKMSELAVEHLRERGVAEIVVAARSPERAERLARGGGGGRGVALTALPEAVASADLVVSATAATSTVLDRDTVEEAIRAREGRKLFLIDLAVPRDIDAKAAQLPGVQLVDIDRLRDAVGRSDTTEIERARAIISEEVGKFGGWRRASRLAPLIQGLYEHGEAIRLVELERARGRLASLSEEEWAAVEAATRAIVAKLIHPVAAGAREESELGEARARLVAELFGIEPGPR